LIVIVDESPELTDAGLKPTVVPAGTPLALSAMLCADPFVTAVLIVDVPLLPCCTLRLLGLAAIEKSSAGGGVTVNETSTECVALEPVPVAVIVYVPGAVPAPTATLIVEELPEETDAGLKLTVVPAGWPLAESATVCAAPLVTVVPIVDVPLLPCATLRLDGLALMEKSDGPLVQLGNLNDAIRVCQLKLPFVVRYSSVYQNVQSSLGSTAMLV
jgi:hypothetical protein